MCTHEYDCECVTTCMCECEMGVYVYVCCEAGLSQGDKSLAI